MSEERKDENYISIPLCLPSMKRRCSMNCNLDFSFLLILPFSLSVVLNFLFLALFRQDKSSRVRTEQIQCNKNIPPFFIWIYIQWRASATQKNKAFYYLLTGMCTYMMTVHYENWNKLLCIRWCTLYTHILYSMLSSIFFIHPHVILYF